jgi:hypothetical protein
MYSSLGGIGCEGLQTVERGCEPAGDAREKGASARLSLTPSPAPLARPAQALCRLLLSAELPAFQRAAAARLLGLWRLRLGEALAHMRRVGYGEPPVRPPPARPPARPLLNPHVVLVDG